MKKLLLLLILCLIAFTGCKKEDNDTFSLIGTWAEAEAEAEERVFIKLNDDETVELWFMYKGEKEESFYYKYKYDTKAKTITFKYQENEEEVIMKIIELNETKLVVKFMEDDEQLTLYRQ